MGNSDKDDVTKPAATNKVSGLFIVSLAIALAIIALAGWGYFSQKAERPDTTVSASAAITAPVEIPAETSRGDSEMDQTGAVTPDQPSETPKEDAVAQEPSSATPAPPAQSNGEADPASPTAPTATDPDTIKDTPPATASDQAGEPLGAPSGESDAATDSTADADEGATFPATPAAPAGSDAEDEAPAIAAAPVTPAPAPAPETETGEADVSDIGDGADADADSSHEEMAVPPAVPPSPAEEVAPATDAAPPAGAEAEEMVEETGEETGASPQTAPDESEAAQATMDTPANAGSQAAADTPAAADRHEPGETNSRSALPPETAPQDAQNANAEAPLPVAPLAAPGNLQSDGEMARDAPPPSPQPTGMKAQDAGDLRPRIAIIISELGMSNAAARQAIAMLPPAISFSFNPYGHNLQQLANEARAAGHEVLLQVPMEPQGYPRLDPGVHGLRTDLTSEENLARLDWALNRFTGYIGITNQMGSKFTKDADALTPVLNEVRGKELIYLDSRTAADSIAADIALDLGIPVVINNRFLDHRAETAVMDENFAALETIARRTGSAVGIAYPSEKSYTYLIDWAKELEAKGLRLVPISALANKQEAR